MPDRYVVPRVYLELVRETPYNTDSRRSTALPSSGAVYAEFSSYFKRRDREEFWLIALDGKNIPLFTNCVSVGTVTASLVHPREVFKPAIIGNATAIILMHNHPSGNPSPSAEDHAITTRLRECGEILGIKILDHIVFGADRYVSFADLDWRPTGLPSS